MLDISKKQIKEHFMRLVVCLINLCTYINTSLLWYWRKNIWSSLSILKLITSFIGKITKEISKLNSSILERSESLCRFFNKSTHACSKYKNDSIVYVLQSGLKKGKCLNDCMWVSRSQEPLLRQEYVIIN